ncbi:secretin N-terminal domain-containing protein [Uliginosibacterium sp. H3]|uniref:Secretin N-terminal domain-containing protein n=1 Tax=Uliginosibacterium silvisoli TaxID=3114758 RepID=A0ABU6K8M4_9RHOO|nr:secretin N-terminal domain-containing protein [Uliginosibacterium sp. H3]
MKKALCFIALLWSVTLVAQQRLEIIPLQYRLPEQVLPTLQNLLEPGGSISGAAGKLFVRTSPENLAQLRRALAALDTPQRRLMISVRQGSSMNAEGSNLGVSSGRVIIGPDGVRASGELNANAGTTIGSSNATQQVQTVDGGDASIFLGRSVPIPMRQMVRQPATGYVTETTQYVDVGTGFVAHPELVGERVVLTISPQNQRIGRYGVIEGTSLNTRIEGRLGEWLPLGGSNVERSNEQRGTLEYRAGRASNSADVWLKVDILE